MILKLFFYLTYNIFIFIRQTLLLMENKLTLRLNEKVIEKAKIYAKDHKISLSKLIENYLESITKQSSTENKTAAITPLVESLSGVIDLPQDFDYKKEYREYLAEKHK